MIVDEQAWSVHVRGQGLVVLTGCGHAGAVNIARHALRLTGVDRCTPSSVFHLTGACSSPSSNRPVDAFRGSAPDVLYPRTAQFESPAPVRGRVPEAFVPNAVGTSFTFAESAA